MQLKLACTMLMLAALGVHCAGGATSAADCMRAMSQVACPPGTAPTSGSAGQSASQVGAGLQTLQVGASSDHNVTCNYYCAAICQCGIDRVMGDGSVICSPCFGASQQALTTNTQVPNTNLHVREQTLRQVPQPVETPRVTLDFTRPPLFEHHSLIAPIRPDPFAIMVAAGGNENIQDAAVVDTTGGECAGYVNAAQPDIAITYSSRGTSLLMSVNSDSDTTLVVNMPDGSWRCNDNANGSTRNPRLYFPDGMSGRYDIWVGTRQRDSSFPTAQFRVTNQL